MHAHELDFAIGVDTHGDAHALAFLRSPSGARLLEAELAACEAGYANALVRALLEGEELARPRARGAREALRVLLSTRESAIQARRCALNQLWALIVFGSHGARQPPTPVSG